MYIILNKIQYKFVINEKVNISKLDIKLLTRMINLIIKYYNQIFIYGNSCEIGLSYFKNPNGLLIGNGNIVICSYNSHNHLIRVCNNSYNTSRLIHQETYS